MDTEAEYKINDIFLKGELVGHLKYEVNQPFGGEYGGVSFYNSLALAIVSSEHIPVEQRVVDIENQPAGPLFESEDGITFTATGQSIPPFKLVPMLIDGRQYFDVYFEGFRTGRQYFNDHYRPDTSMVYGPGVTDYTTNLHELYKHRDMGWLWNARAHSKLITTRIIEQYGYYAGLCFSVDLVIDKYPHLLDAITRCKERAHITLSLPQVALLYHLTGRLITINNANEIARNYGQTSGEKLKRDFDFFENPENRTAPTKVSIKNYKEVMPLLANMPAAKQLAEKELKEAIRRAKK